MSPEDQVTYDASGSYFCSGITDFNLANVYQACRLARITSRLLDEVHIELDLVIYDRLDASNQLDHYPDGVTRWRKFTVSISPNYEPRGYVRTCKITDKAGNVAYLKTREC